MGRMNGEYIDIHGYPAKYKATVGHLRKCGISERNKKLILKFDETLFLVDQVGLARRVRVIGYLTHLTKCYLKKNLDKATRDDIKKAVKKIEDNQEYSIWTKHGYRVVIKKFYRWLKYGDDYNSPENRFSFPKTVSWISCNIKKVQKPKITAENILTENEITRLLEAASDDVKNEAIIAVLYESGCRIGEHGSVRLKHVKKESNCYCINVKGKTGEREIFIAKLAGILTDWLNIHPYKDDPEAPLWVRHKSKEPMMYKSFVQIIKRTALKANINKRIYPHIFRHSRATHAIINGEFTSNGAKKLFGWCPSSDMMETYIHLTSADVKDSYLKKLGLSQKDNHSLLDPKICPNCRHPNLYNSSICENCKCLLDNDLGIEMDDRMVRMRKFLYMLSKDQYIKFRIEQMADENMEIMNVIEGIAHEKNETQA